MNSFSRKLLDWFDRCGRHDLPWQEQKTAYRVWVSEIMLQQTQVKTVIPYYQRFMARFPALEDLAEATQEEVLAHWAGLGYYARGRNLHKAAQVVQESHHGVFPSDFDAIVALPGIGRSTAGAILSIAHQKRYPILDGNVKRVLSRYFAQEGWPGEKAVENRLWEASEQLTPPARFDDYTQAIMDLGATLCTRSRPRCQDCPVAETCQAYQRDEVSRFPFSKPKKSKPVRQACLAMLVNRDQRVWLERRPQKGIWGGLWSLPQYESEADLQQALKPVRERDVGCSQSLIKWDKFRHTFSHYHLDIEPVKVAQVHEAPADWCGQWHEMEQASELGLPAPVKTLIERLVQETTADRSMG